jgi:hypothetical protein
MIYPRKISYRKYQPIAKGKNTRRRFLEKIRIVEKIVVGLYEAYGSEIKNPEDNERLRIWRRGASFVIRQMREL